MSPVISRCHAKCTSLSLGTINYFFNSFGLSCFFSIQAHIIFSVSKMLHSAAGRKPVHPFPGCVSKNSSVLSSDSLKQLHTVYNDCKLLYLLLGATPWIQHCLWIVTIYTLANLCWFAFLQPRTTFYLVLVHDCSLLPIARQSTHSKLCASNNSSVFISDSIAQIRYISNACKMLWSTDCCHTMQP